VRNNIENSIEGDSMHTRWEVLKSMLDEFPQLRDRTIHYILQTRSKPKPESEYQMTPEIKELIQRAIVDHKLERMKR
jgi:hypothetical protein